MTVYLNENTEKKFPITDPMSGTHLSDLITSPHIIPQIYEIVTSTISILHEETELSKLSKTTHMGE